MKMTYKAAGVDVQTGDRLSHLAKTIAQSTYRPEIWETHGIATFSAKFKAFKEPLLLGATDGVGTKLKIAFAAGEHRSVGIDVVAMCVNDLVRRGAEPLFFLPYIAMNKLKPAVIKQIMQGITRGCRKAGCAIIGGETAELSDIYKLGEYDLAGTAVGIVEKRKIITGDKIRHGDSIIGIASSGLHSNGFTLVRKVVLGKYKLADTPLELRGNSIEEELLTPTEIYVKPILKLLKLNAEIHGIAHITGGGILGKLGSIIAKQLTAHIKSDSWIQPPIFSLIQKLGNIEEKEMYRTFNMGLGMILIIRESDLTKLDDLGQKYYVIGRIEKGTQPVMLH